MNNIKDSLSTLTVVPILKKSEFEHIKLNTYPKNQEISIRTLLDSLVNFISKEKMQLDYLDSLIKSRFIRLFRFAD